MSSYTRRQKPAVQQGSAGQTHSQRVSVSDTLRPEDTKALPFPNKPVFHRRPAGPQLHPSDLEKLTVSSHPGAPESSRRPPDGAIRAKQLLLHQKLLKVAERVEERVQRRGCDAAGDGGPRTGAGRGAAPAQGRHGLHEDARGPRLGEDQRTDTRGMGARRTAGAPQSGANKFKVSHQQEQGVSREQNKVGWQDVRRRHGGRRGEAKEGDVWGRTWRDGSNQELGSGQNSGPTSERKGGERTQSVGSDDVRDLPERGRKGDPRGRSSPPPDSGAGWRREDRERVREGPGGGGGFRTLPCKICHRSFAEDRLEKHTGICRKVGRARPVYNSYAHRTKGSAAEEFHKTHERSATPEVIKKKHQRRKSTRNATDLRQIERAVKVV